MDLNKMYHANCFDLMSQMASENQKVTHVITSPPYFSEQQCDERNYRQFNHKKVFQICKLMARD